MAGTHLTETVGLTVEDNRRMITHIMKTFDAPPVDLTDPKAIERRINEYFTACADAGLRPGNLGMYSALGLTRQDVNNFIHGRSHRVNPECIDIIQKGIRAMSTYRELLVNHGRLNPVSYIFQAKNFDHLADVQAFEISRADEARQLEASMTPAQIAARIEADIPIDDYSAEVLPGPGQDT